jgi:hypothetical protein
MDVGAFEVRASCRVDSKALGWTTGVWMGRILLETVVKIDIVL